MITHADRRRDVSHADRMKARRKRQLARTVGFTSVPNKRIDAAIESTTTVLTLGYQQENLKYGRAIPPAHEIRAEAIRAVARTLPAPPIGVRIR